MDNINLGVTTAFYKAVILPEESGIYKATTDDGTNFYVIVEDSCADDIQIKWLGAKGIYKHGIFSKYITEKQTSIEGIKIEVYNYSLSTAKAISSLISKSNQRTLILKKKTVQRSIFELYLDLAKSPKVYLNLGSQIEDIWVEVTVKWNPVLSTKKEFQDITIEVELPEDFIQRL